MFKRTLRHVLREHTGIITRIEWSPNGDILASASNDKTIRFWDVDRKGNMIKSFDSPYNTITNLAWAPDGSSLAMSSIYESIYIMDPLTGRHQAKVSGHSGWITSMSWSPDGKALVSSCADELIRVWGTENYMLIESLRGHEGMIRCVAWSPDVKRLASSSAGGNILLWDTESWKQIKTLKRDASSIDCLAWSPDAKILASSYTDYAICIWNPEDGKIINVFEGNQENISALSFSSDGNILASMDGMGLVYLWCCNTGEVIDTFSDPAFGRLRGGLAFNPKKPILALICQKKGEINVYDLEIDKADNIDPSSDPSCGNYVAAKFLLVGDSVVDRPVNGTSVKQADETVKQIYDDRHICSLDNRKVELEDGSMEMREIILSDLTCQPGYKDIYPLQMKNLSGALVLFNALNKTASFDGIRSWSKAFSKTFDQAQSMYSDSRSVFRKVLIAIHPDPEGSSKESKEVIKSIEEMANELGFDNYFITNKKELENITGLADALHKMVAWESIQKVDSIELLNSVKEFIIKQKDSGQLFSNTDVLFEEFINIHKSLSEVVDMRSQFNTCIQYVELSCYLRQLHSGRLILFMPELFNTYVLAMINVAKNESNGLGIILEEDASSGRFKIPEETRIKDTEQEKLFLSTAIEELLFFKVAIRVATSRGRFLVFPLQITRKDQDMGEPVGKAEIIQFKGSVINIFAALTVSISLSIMFKKKEIWKNAAAFITANGATCGILLSKIDGDSGEIVLFFSSMMSHETSRQFQKLIITNLTHLALPDSTIHQHIVSCPSCGKVTTAKAVDQQRGSGHATINCPMCNTPIALPDANKSKEPLRSAHQSTSINLDFLRTSDRIVQTAPKIAKTVAAKPVSTNKPEVESETTFTPPKLKTRSLRAWAGSSKCTLALVFTDIVGSTSLCNKVGNDTFNKMRQSHFTKARYLLRKHSGYEIKTIGDSVMAAFRAASEAFDFAIEFCAQTGDKRIKIRVGTHVGPVSVEQNDAFGLTVNYTARIEKMAQVSEVWLSNEAKTHIEQDGLDQHSKVKWLSHPDCDLKGFDGKHTLWSAKADI
ncbi:MAG: WD40 domain-containing protein [Candidatus Anammoxibacter sp.]